MNLNKVELKKVISDFNSISNRLMRAHFQDYHIVLKMFLAFIREHEIICEYVEDCGLPLFDVETEFKEIANSHGHLIFDLGKTNKEETANIFGILQYVVEKNIDMISSIGFSYLRSTKIQDILNEINKRIVYVLIMHISDYLTKIGIEMGLNETETYNITVTNGQVNVASDNAIINATINNNIDQNELLKHINDVKKTIPIDISSDEKDSVNGSLELIETELKQETPRKGIIQSAMTALKAVRESVKISTVKGAVEFSAAIATLVEFISTRL